MTLRSARRNPSLHLVLLALAVSCRPSDLDPGAGLMLVVSSGANQVATVGTAVAVLPTVQLRDQTGRGVAGVALHFAVQPGSGHLTGDTVTTNSNGMASVGGWTLGTASGADTLRVMVLGSTVSAAIAAMAIPGSPATMKPVGAQSFAAFVSQTIAPAPVVEVRDTYGNVTPDVHVTFSIVSNGGSVSGGSTVTDALGRASPTSWTLGASAGLNRLYAATSNAAGVLFTAQGVTSAPTIAAVTPLTQTGYLAFPVTAIPRVLVTDNLGTPLQNVPVTFALGSAGDATLSGGSAVTGSDGIASPIDWRLGATGTSSAVTATITGFPTQPVTFTATGVAAAFRIDLRFLTTLTANQRDAFVAAARRWMQIITAGIPSTQVTLPAGSCANGLSPAMNESISNVVIFVEVDYIDGLNGILGSSGPCVRRSQTYLTAVGQMRFDVADLAPLETTNRLVATITHEMAHVLGYGTSWQDLGLAQDWGTSDPIFIGAATLPLWPLVNLGYAGRPVPLENLYGVGTRNVHWRESVFHTELMTGYIEPPGTFMPLSRITIASIKDLGYQVDFSQADPFAGDIVASESVSAGRILINEVLQPAEFEVGADRRMLRITRP